MQSELAFEDFIDPDSIEEIVSSKTFRDGAWKRLTTLSGFQPNVDKCVVPVDLGRFHILVVTTVPGGTTVGAHAHDEPILRYVMDGSLAINGALYERGDWILVPKDVEYSVSTEHGYTTIAGYGQACDD